MHSYIHIMHMLGSFFLITVENKQLSLDCCSKIYWANCCIDAHRHNEWTTLFSRILRTCYCCCFHTDDGDDNNRCVQSWKNLESKRVSISCQTACPRDVELSKCLQGNNLFTPLKLGVSISSHIVFLVYNGANWKNGLFY